MSGPDIEVIVGRLDAIHAANRHRTVAFIGSLVVILGAMLGAGTYYYQTRDRADAQHDELERTKIEPLRLKLDASSLRVDAIREIQVENTTKVNALERTMERVDAKFDAIMERLPQRRRSDR